MKSIGLETDERILATTRRHWIILVRDEAGTISLGIAPFLLLGVMAIGFPDLGHRTFLHVLGFAEVLWVLLVWLAIAAIWTNYYLDTWIVTNRRIVSVDQVGLFERRTTSWRFETMREVATATKNPLQTLFNYGSVRFRTGDGAKNVVYVEGIPHPEAFSALLLEQAEAFRRLEDTNRKQEMLLHTVSHETKAHLTKNEAAFASIVEGDYGDVPEKLKMMVRDALAETRSGVSMMMNLLSASDFKTGAVQLNLSTFDIAASVRTICAELELSARAKGLALTYAVEGAPFSVRGDEEKLREHVIRNLVDNAIHYTKQGTVLARLLRVENAVVLKVTDTGIGISPEDIPRLFTEGGKGAKSSAINPSSTGYGLFIAKQIVEAHGGAIWAESEGAEKGSTFYVALPEIAPPQGEKVPRSSAPTHAV